MKKLWLLFPLLFLVACGATGTGPDITTEDLSNTFWQGDGFTAFINNLYVIQIDKGDELYFYGQLDEPGENEKNYVFTATPTLNRYEDETSKISMLRSEKLELELSESELICTDENGDEVRLTYDTQGSEETFTGILDKSITT